MTNIIPFSEIIEENGKTVRENNCGIKHKIAIGQLVEVKYDEYFGNNAGQKVHAHLYVISHDRDCDGTPLYTVARKPRDQWHVFEDSDPRDPYEVWRKAPLSSAGLLIASCYHPVSGLNEEQLRLLSEDALPLTDVPTPRWPDCFASEDLREAIQEAVRQSVIAHLRSERYAPEHRLGNTFVENIAQEISANAAADLMLSGLGARKPKR